MEDNTSVTTQHSGETNSGKHQFDSPDLASGQAICTSYLTGAVFGETVPDYLEFVLNADEATGTLHLSSVSGSGTGNYGVYETEGGALTGVYISRDTLGVSDEAEPDEFPQEIPFALSEADEADFEEEAVDDEMQEEAEGLLS